MDLQALRASGPAPVILLVEDEANLRELTRVLLEDLGYDVVEAGTGEQALQNWEGQKEHIKLLLTDFVLPDGLTGFELAEQLRRSRADLPVILTSGYDADKVLDSPGQRGFGFVQKPYRAEALADAIQQVLGDHETVK